jgi:hypothetical protein
MNAVMSLHLGALQGKHLERLRGIPAREVSSATESRLAKEAYCDPVHRFDYLTWINWRKGRPTRARIRNSFAGGTSNERHR